MSIDDNMYMLPKGTSPVPKLAIAAIVILLAGVISMIVYIKSKPNSSQEATPGQELVVGIDRATLYVPKDAATLDGVISISSLKPNLYSIVGEEQEWFRSQVVDVQYLNSQGQPYLDVIFPKPALICFMIKERWDDYTQHPDEYLVQYYAEEQSPPGWVTLPMSANADRYELCGQTDHLSIFALALKPQEEIPITGGTLLPTSVGSITPTPTGMLNLAPSPTPTKGGDTVATPVSTQAALTATSVALTATDVPTNVPTVVPTNIPTDIPTIAPTAVPTNPPEPTATEPPVPTDPPTEPPTDPPPTDPPPTDPPPTDPPPTDPPPTDPPATDPPTG